MPHAVSIETILDRVKESGNNKNPLLSDITSCLAVEPNDSALREIVGLETTPGLIERQITGNPFVPTAPVQEDLAPRTPIILGKVPDTGALWSLSDEPILCHILGVGGSGIGGKTSWLLLVAAEILAHENGGSSCPFTHHSAGVLTR
jgi:hypothetical protein